MPVPLTIDPEFRSLIAPLRPDESEELEKSLRRDGCLEPLSVWRTDGKIVLLDGHNRYDICRRHLIQYETKTIEHLASRDDARLWIEQHQISRRNLTDDQRAMIWDSIRERRSKVARSERASKAGKIGGVGRPRNSLSDRVSEKLSPAAEPKKDILASVTRESKLPERNLRMAHAIKKANPELAAKVRSGEMSLKRAWSQCRPSLRRPARFRRRRKEKPELLPNSRGRCHNGPLKLDLKMTNLTPAQE